MQQHISLKQSVIIVIYQQILRYYCRTLQNKHGHQVQNISRTFQETYEFLQRVQKITSVGCY